MVLGTCCTHWLGRVSRMDTNGRSRQFVGLMWHLMFQCPLSISWKNYLFFFFLFWKYTCKDTSASHEVGDAGDDAYAWRLNPLRWRINWKTALTSRDLFPWKLNYFWFLSIGGTPAKTSVLVMKLVMQEMMHTFDSFQMGLRGLAKTWPFPQGINCVLDINGQSRQFVGLMWRLMFESPRMENQLEDIVNLNGSFFLKINIFLSFDWILWSQRKTKGAETMEGNHILVKLKPSSYSKILVPWFSYICILRTTSYLNLGSVRWSRWVHAKWTDDARGMVRQNVERLYIERLKEEGHK